MPIYRNIEMNSEFDLIYFDEYRTASDDIQKLAQEQYRAGEEVPKILEFCTKQTRIKLAQKLKNDSSLGKRFLSRTFENFKAETTEQKLALQKALNYIRDIDEMIEAGTGLVIVGQGRVGTGKTHLACAVANKLLDNGYPTKVINVTRMIYQIKSDFKVEEYLKVPILLIDDLGKEICTPWVAETLYFIFNERYEAMLPTIITTEFGLKELKENYTVQNGNKAIERGKAIVSRLTEDFIYIPLTGADYRQKRDKYQ